MEQPKVPPTYTPPTEHAAHLAQLVQSRALSAGRPVATRSDWLITLVERGETWVSGYLLEVLGANTTTLLRKLQAVEARADPSALEPAPLQLFTEAVDVARRLGHRYIGTEHVLLAFARADDSLGATLAEAGATWDAVSDAFAAIEWNAPPSMPPHP